MTPIEPQRPIQEPYESDDEFEERLDKYAERWKNYNIACDTAIDAQRDRECERALFGEATA